MRSSGPLRHWYCIGPELPEQVTLARGIGLRMAHDHVAAGFAAVIDDFWDGSATP